ncbi:bacterial lipocalin [Mycolicibacterium chubuense NBB4]|uniref:Bacterial lipocalin n=1 Tax=Mycolicibacterium chubuense (strain NBB4) TaxID=710421 RepID=I4BD20_MYCCN|nr:lipocalin family protein [Mycolicibacterium chubuense]AFM15177.1 bacterial lipocalin [Mycolicibacterium chubuense NBB4]
MTSRHWGYWVGVVGVGAGIALSAGHGVAAADTDSSDGAGPASRSADQNSSPTRHSLTRKAKAGREAAASPSDPSSPPSLGKRRHAEADDASDTRPSRVRSGRLVTLRQPDAVEARSSDAPKRRSPGPLAGAALNVLTAAAKPVRPETTATPEPQALSAPAASTTVSGVKTGHATLDIPIGTKGFTTGADWYFPTQADGSVSATGVIWLQHGFMGRKFFYSALAENLSQQTNSIVVAPNLPSFPSLRCGGCWLNGVPTQQAVAAMFLGDEASLNSSAAAAGFVGTLPEDFVLTGHSAGGGLAAAAGGYYAADPANGGNLRGVVMFDGFAFPTVVPDALQRLNDPFIPVYQIAAPPQLGNLFGATTRELVAARPGQFVGVTLAHGSHVDSLIGGNPIVDLLSQLVTRFSPPGNTTAVYTLATGWINDLYQGLGPTDGTGIYGAPDQYLVLGDAAGVVLAPPPVVDVNSYLGTWYEVGSVKQFFSIGLVNTKAVYSLNPDGSIKVENSGNYFFDNGPKSAIVGAALPVDAANNKLNVTFFGKPKANPPGNYWIVDLAPDYSWAIVTDPTGLSGFLLSRTPTVSPEFYQQLLDRASVDGVRGRITQTRQPGAAAAGSASA